MSLIAKLTLSISAALLLIMAPFSLLTVKAIKKLLYEEAVSAADNISETIIKTTYYDMLEDDRERVFQMVQEAGTQHGVEHIRMITKDGQIIFSTDREEVGSYLDKSASACDMCHSGETPLKQVSTMNRARVFRNEAGDEVLGISKAIYNEESCYTAECHVHPKDQNIVGVLDTIVSLERMRVQTRSYALRLVALTVVMLALVGVSLMLLVQRLVNRPVKKVLQHTKKVGRLQFHATLALESRDEIGELARAFNEMTEKLNTARTQLEEWARTLESKVEERTEEIQRMQTQLVRSEKLASLGELVAGIAHELNNPLTGILVLSSIMQKEAKLDPTTRDDVETIVHESQRCARIVKGLLDFSRESIPQKRPCQINDVIDSTLVLVRTQALFHDIEIVKKYGEGLPEVLADPHQLEQVLINVLLNAAQAMPNGGRLVLETTPRPAQVVVRIADTGGGIPPENLGRIFDPFFTTKESRGTGLGLSVSYGIVQNHGGTIEVESELGVGTAFTIQLPIAAAEPSTAEEPLEET
ncbi:MAG: sensor histidine kinase [Deferrisomatales bacterium]